MSGDAAILTFSQKIPSAWRYFSNGRRKKKGGVGGGKKVCLDSSP